MKRGEEYFLINEFEKAKNDFKSALELKPVNIDAYFSRAEAKLGLNDFLAAAVDYTIVISMDSTEALAYYNRGICYANLDLKNNACEDFNKAGELGFFQAYEVIKEYCAEKENVKKKK